MKAVDNGELNYVSPSQIKDFTTCERKWWFAKVAGIKVPNDPASEARMNLGTALHTQVENYFLNGTVPEHPSAKLSLEHLPQPGENVLIESALVDPAITISGVPVVGRADLIKAPGENGELLWVWDHKSASSKRYNKKPHELEEDLQLTVYAKWASTKFNYSGDVNVSHNYIFTKDEGAKPVTGTLSQERIEQNLSQYEPVVERMKAAARCTNPEDVPRDQSKCTKPWPCPFFKICHPTQDEQLDQLFFEESEPNG